VTLALRADQRSIVQSIRASFAKGRHSPCIVMPPGAGKTATILTYLDQHEPEARVLWLEPRAALVDQVWKSAGEWMPKTRERLRVATVQGILASNQPPPMADLCVVDEAHFFFGSPEWSAVPHLYPRRIAASATPTRVDGTALGELSDELIVGYSRKALTRIGVLPPIITYSSKKRSTEAMSPVQAYQSRTLGERAIVFCGSIDHAKAVADSFRKAGVRAGCATSEDDTDLQLHRAGHLEVLTNVFMVSVGYDDPTITVAILARPMGNASTYLQAVGRARGLGAPRVALLDLYGSCHEWGLPEDDRTYSLKGKAIRLKKGEALAACETCEAMYRPNPFIRECPLCRAPVVKFKTPVEKQRDKLEATRKAESFDVRRGFFIKMAHTSQKLGRLWLAKSAYRKRYGLNPPQEWILEFDLE